jgi:CheY-like chemotaxis protein
MGLGLAISRRLVELHGGAITAHSNGQDGDGSTFTFTLPVFPNRQACDDPAAERRSAVLLLAEHAARSQALYRHLLSKGFTVEVLDVSEQPDWLAQVAACPPGAVVLDFQPAAERGWELMQMLKQNPDTRQTPVIFTNLAAQSGRGAVLEMDYLSKPLAPADLSQVLERLGLKRGQAEPAGAPRKTILLVDDDPKVLEMHARMLESLAPLRILRAYGGRQALELMQTETIDLVLLDLMMPDVDGFEVLRIMRLQEATRSLPVIVLSAQILTAHDMERLQQGVAAVLGKGLFSMSEVLAQVEGALAHSKRLGSAASRTVREAMAFIHERYAEPLTRSRIAAHVAITERYLTHCFRQELGVTPVTYLNRYRVTRARQMLEASDHTITEVALAVGFSDASYFNRVFRQEVGVTPSEWRRGTN